MDIKNKVSLHMYSRRKKRKKADLAQLAAQLAPPEEQGRPVAQQAGTNNSSIHGQASQDNGAIIVDNDNLHVPRDMMEAGGEGRFMGMETVVLVILIVMLGFITFIAWQISQMPAK